MKFQQTKLFTVFLFFLIFTGCKNENETNSNALYASKAFTVYKDSIVQGKNKAVIVSSDEMTSNYISPMYANYSNFISFKISINEKDIEMPSGKNHHVLIENGSHESPVFTFGKITRNAVKDKGETLPTNYNYTFQVDMSPVLDQFKKQGFYQAFDGTKIAKQDFKGFYIAGGSEPLTWDFSNLEENNLELTDPDGDGIYTIALTMNPFDTSEAEQKTWKLSEDISQKPHYTSDQPIVNALYNLATEEAIKNIEPDSTFRTGAEWGGVWTRDISYSIYLAFAYHEPEVAKISLMRKVKRDRIIQDTGSGGAWPVSSDRVVWAVAAWEIYKVTGDTDWLKKTYKIIKNTLEDDAKTLVSSNGLYKGESSFLDWREQTYPKWMSNMDIAESKNLGTNVLHYEANTILGKMADALGDSSSEYDARAKAIKEAINKELWLPEDGFYAQYEYGRAYFNTSKRFEALGEALAILFDVADSEKAKAISTESPVTPFGVTCIYPQIPGIPPYHNNGVWPFVQSYWNLASAKVGNEKALNYGLAAIYRPAALFLSNYENFEADNGDFRGTEINSNRMLWSMAGNLAMVHRVFMGMHFQKDGILFQPVVPEAYKGKKELSNFKYRKASLDITVEGFGNKIKTFKIDGETKEKPFLPSGLDGKHKVSIQLIDTSFDTDTIHHVENKFSLPNPVVTVKNNILSWDSIPGAQFYKVYKNGEMISEIRTITFQGEDQSFSEYKVSAVGPDGYESFTSEPVWLFKPQEETIVEVENYYQLSNKNYINYSGKGFVALTRETNRTIEIPVHINEPGTYIVDFRYSNGSGPWNTDNKCAIRSLYVNKNYQGVAVFPQRGKDEWSDWGYSNSFKVDLKKGQNTLILKFEDWNNNMNVDVNTAMLDHVRVIKL
ncbi:alpha-L-rhamnosidase-related protein [Gaetbulibacter aestuarii]|uniref:CBM6 domain-containing protein n=1 Tax=Gaetbulibacter aestuarii TaxID=1502358 RepID=A0ABW7MUE0_9FLAO